jgi:hypothetical protein
MSGAAEKLKSKSKGFDPPAPDYVQMPAVQAQLKR